MSSVRKSAQIESDEEIVAQNLRRKNLIWVILFFICLIIQAVLIKKPDQLIQLGLGIMFLLNFSAFHCKWGDPYDKTLDRCAKSWMIFMCCVAAVVVIKLVI